MVAPLLRVGEEVALFSGNPVFCALGLGGCVVLLLTREVVLEVGMRATDKDGCFASGSGCGSWFVCPLASVCAWIFDAAAILCILVVNVFLNDGIDLGEVTGGAADKVFFAGIPILCKNALRVTVFSIFLSNPFTDAPLSSVGKDAALFSVCSALV